MITEDQLLQALKLLQEIYNMTNRDGVVMKGPVLRNVGTVIQILESGVKDPK